ncbi:MAG TPA: Amuc_1100 family pilus-like protein, partial [Opitutus sp.]|nr:Amuc_1100 family pilus-like protein [Opitutus sp.]
MLAAIVLIAVGEGWWWRERVEAGRRAEEKLARLRDEEKTLAAATAADFDAMADLADARAELAVLNLRVADRLERGEVPRQRAEAYFDLATFAARMRTAAAQHGVELAPDEHFGFAEYAGKGPAPALIDAVFLDRLRVEYLLRTLFASRPSRLVSVQRERVETEGAERQRGADDTFEFASTRSVRVPGLLAGRAFKLTFIAGTASVRALLDGFTVSDQPITVRSVEAARIDGAEIRSLANGHSEEPRLLVAGGDSRFTVTVEWVAAERPLAFAEETTADSRGQSERSA